MNVGRRYLSVCDKEVWSGQGRDLCWAACIEMILRHDSECSRWSGPIFTQFQIAAFIGKSAQPASKAEIEYAIKKIGYKLIELNPAHAEVFQALSKGYPVMLGLPGIAGAVGHVVLAVGYWVDPPQQIKVFDPGEKDPFQLWGQDLQRPYIWAILPTPPPN